MLLKAALRACLADPNVSISPDLREMLEYTVENDEGPPVNESESTTAEVAPQQLAKKGGRQ